MPFFVMGLLNNVIPFGFLFAAQTLFSVGLTSIVNAMTPLFTIVVMAALGVERLTGSRIAGVVLGVVGVAVFRGVGGGRGDRDLAQSCRHAQLWFRGIMDAAPFAGHAAAEICDVPASVFDRADNPRGGAVRPTLDVLYAE